MLTLIKIKIFLLNFKDFCVKYWRALVAFCLVVVGILIGRRSKSNEETISKIENLDAKSEAKNAEEKMNAIIDINQKYVENVVAITDEKQKKIKQIETQKLKNIDEMSNNSENLDRILKEKYNLNKGE